MFEVFNPLARFFKEKYNACQTLEISCKPRETLNAFADIWQGLESADNLLQSCVIVILNVPPAAVDNIQPRR